MARPLASLIERAINSVTGLLTSLSSSDQHKAEKLAYWLVDYSNYIEHEEAFSPKDLIRYKRGQVLKVHFGFNIGNELGGLHYAIVVENNNPLSSGIVTVVPLTSIKSNKPLTDGRVSLGAEIYNKVFTKSKTCVSAVSERVDALMKALESTDKTTVSAEYVKQLRSELVACQADVAYNSRMLDEINKMKTGSIAHVNQICAVSKIRIKDPKSQHDVLNGIRISDALMDEIDREIIKIFTKKK